MRRVAFILTAVGGLLWVALFGGLIMLGTGMLGAQSHLREMERAFRTELDAATNPESDEAGEVARSAADKAVAAARRARWGHGLTSPLLDVSLAVPQVRGVTVELPDLLDAGESATTAAQKSIYLVQDSLGPESGIIDRSGEGARIRIEGLVDLRDEVVSIIGLLGDAADSLRNVEPSNLPGRFRGNIRRSIDQAEETRTILLDARDGLALMPAFLGEDRPRTYLLAMQNPAELRGTGGAMLQMAFLTADAGKMELGETATIYNVDRDRQTLQIPLPKDAWYVREITDAQRFGNANWSPDWPLSSDVTLRYGRASEKEFGVELPDQIDGVIGVSPMTMQELLPGAGKYQVRAGHRIRPGRVVHFLLYQAYARYPIPGQRRAVLRQVVDGFYERLFDPRHPSRLVSGAGDALGGKHMLLWLTDPELQAFVERMDWDGAIDVPKRSDYFYLVEQNVGGNKLDYWQDHTYEIDVRPEGSDARVSSKVSVHNGVFLPQPRWSMGDSKARHRPMLNLYVRPNAELLGVDAPEVVEGQNVWHPSQFKTGRLETPSPAVWTDGNPPVHDERGAQVWTGTLQIPPGETASLGFDYLVPGVIERDGDRMVYRLAIQWQPKVRPDHLIVRFRLPADASDVRAPGWERDGGVMVFDKKLKGDLELEVSWRR